jgi:GT2 family glycosyltransferase
LLPRVLYDRTGGFDERIYPNYFEDTAFGVELERVGSSTVMLSDVEVLHEMHGGDNSAERLEAIFDKVCRNRWVLTMVALRGRERLWTMAMGLPRTAARSLEARSLTPLRGYLYALRHLRALAAPKPAVGDVGRRGSWMDG